MWCIRLILYSFKFNSMNEAFSHDICSTFWGSNGLFFSETGSIWAAQPVQYLFCGQSEVIRQDLSVFESTGQIAHDIFIVQLVILVEVFFERSVVFVETKHIEKNQHGSSHYTLAFTCDWLKLTDTLSCQLNNYTLLDDWHTDWLTDRLNVQHDWLTVYLWLNDWDLFMYT